MGDSPPVHESTNEVTPMARKASRRVDFMRFFSSPRGGSSRRATIGYVTGLFQIAPAARRPAILFRFRGGQRSGNRCVKVGVAEGCLHATATRTIRGLPRPLARAMESYADRLDVDAVRDAYELAKEAHAGQRRASGDEFVSHAVEVATILALLGLDTDSLVSGLVHTTSSRTRPSPWPTSTSASARACPPSWTGSRRSVAWSSAPTPNSRSTPTASSSSPMARDARVILVKLADRLHNMRTLDALKPGKTAPDRPRDAGDLRPAGASSGDGRHPLGAGGPGLQVSGARRPREAGQEGPPAAQGARATDPGDEAPPR